MAPNSEKSCEGVAESPNAPVGRQAIEGDPKSQRTKATRHPRWTRQETLVLIEAKKMVENGEQVCRYRSASGFVHTDPKWDLVSSFCHQQGVKRGAVQCRKRWGNLLTDFRKIKKWESSVKEESESFWIMRSDVRKEKKLPGFFDTVVYNVLDGGVCTAAAFPLSRVKMTSKVENGDQVEGMVGGKYKEDEDDDHEEEDEAIVESEKMGWSTDEENMETNITGNMVNGYLKISSLKEKSTRGSLKMTHTLTLPASGCHKEAMFQEGYKRKRLTSDDSADNTDFNNNIIKVLRRNSNILKTHIGSQNINCQLARDQQKQQTDSLVTALGKLTDALTKIADKL
ncbi:trihelix transcription factor ASR3-like [Abrus precatorius]|uniref:Trihelix transcription factor ASR3-like n=1 Tax=Abrus precatorius TaxID=3816 RepID=A0A8B8KIR6_ABRPR|nr:trihelix transcription factor ASR3-like [Abrus precatorius]